MSELCSSHTIKGNGDNFFKRKFVCQHYCWPALNIVGLFGLSARRPVLLSALCCRCQRQSRSLFSPVACFSLSDIFFSFCLKTVRLIRAAGGAVWLCIHSVWVSHDIWNMLYAWNLTFGNMIPALRKRATWVDFSASYSTCRLVWLSWLSLSVHCLPLSLQCWLGLYHFWFCPVTVAVPHVPAHCHPAVGLHRGIKCTPFSLSDSHKHKDKYKEKEHKHKDHKKDKEREKSKHGNG